MSTIQQLISDIAQARGEYLAAIASATETQAAWKPAPDVWNITEITEHLFWAEQGGLCGMWKTLLAIREGRMPQSYESVHKGLPIQQIIDRTWKPKETVPAVASPRMGGSLAFWRASLSSLQPILEEFGTVIKADELRLQAHPHPISGAMDFQQRFEFLRFHLSRHKVQAAGLMAQYREQAQ